MRTQASYRIFGDDSALTAARVTQTLGLPASRTMEAGERVGRNGPPTKASGWWLASGDEPEDGVELSAQLGRVLATLMPQREALWSLVADGYRIDWFCYLGSHPMERAVELPRELLVDLLRVPGELLLDIYDDHPDEAD